MAGKTTTRADIGIRDIDVQKTWCLSGTLNFTRYFFRERFRRKFEVGMHHRTISNALDRVLKGECKRLIINVAPRYSKTELAVKNFIAMGLALNPRAKFIHLSYSDDLARLNSQEVQEIMKSVEYKRLFGTHPTTKGTKMWTTPEGGGLYAVSTGGQVTGFGAGLVDDEAENEIDRITQAISLDPDFGGAIIIDDPIKPEDAFSSRVREKVNQRFDTTIRNRVNSRNTPIIIIMQRLHEEDLCGYLLASEADKWDVVSLPVIYRDDEGEEQALWPFKATLEELYIERERNPFVFETQYMQNPRPIQGLMYERGFKEYEQRPITKQLRRKACVDTADTGEDFLCAIIYDETEEGNFVLDTLYTKRTMEFTEPELARMLTKYEVEECIVESNNGGRGFQRNVEAQCRKMGNNKTYFQWFHQTLNKEQRIFAAANEVQNIVYMPSGWQRLFPEFARDILTYMKVGSNAHDDAPDCLTATVEKRRRGATNVAALFGRLR